MQPKQLFKFPRNISRALAGLVTVLGNIVSEVQSAFIAGRQILDGPFILNEVLHWCFKKKKKSLLFKVDFEKAYDSVRWDFLEDVLKKFGFGNKWCNWILCCLNSSKGSILVNGSPTEEFQFYKGLKQGDPLSPFLFILVMERLHLSFQRVVDTGMFKGLTLNDSLCLSRMFYADDAIFVGQWSDGLKINLRKSKIMGVNVDYSCVNQAAVTLGCQILDTPVMYLGTKVGGNMSRVQAWQEVVEKVKAPLSKWKMNTLFIGGRLTLLKSVLGSFPIFHMSIFRVPSKILQLLESIRGRFFNGYEIGSNKASWVKWNNVTKDKKRGDLGGAEQTQFIILEDPIRSIILVPMNDRWVWNLESTGDFSVSSIRRKNDEIYLPNSSDSTRWVKCVPIKVNILAWKIRCDGLPTRINCLGEILILMPFLVPFVIMVLNRRSTCSLVARRFKKSVKR
nr:RNA-directed DNA polymerase, eukaryota [Tanacetum cinerariifolium]